MLVSLQVELTKSLDQIQISIVFLQKANNHFRESSVFRQIGDFSSKANVLVLKSINELYAYWIDRKVLFICYHVKVKVVVVTSVKKKKKKTMVAVMSIA